MALRTIALVNGRQLGESHRKLRLRSRLRQVDVATKAGIPRAKVIDLEAGQIEELRVREIAGCFRAIGADLRLSAWWRGAAIDRLLDEGHALLVGAVVGLLRRFGWLVEVEVTFSEYGERGSIDVLAFHPPTRTLAVIEIKSEVGGIDPTLRPLDIKVRLAPKIALRFGWRAADLVARVVVLPEDRTARRDVDRHSRVLNAALPARAREIRAWLRSPKGPMAGIWFLSYVGPAAHKRNPSAQRRVRRPKPRSTEGSTAPTPPE